MRRWLLVGLLLFSAGFAMAQPRADTSTRDALEDEISRYEDLRNARNADISRIEAELGETASTLQARIRDRDYISSQIADLRVERAVLQDDIARLEQELADTAAEIDVILGNLDALMGRIRALLVNLYTQGNSRYAQALSQATSYHDFQVRSHYLSLLTEQDVDLVNDLNDTRQQLLDAQARQQEQLAAQSAAEEQLRVNEAELVAQQDSLAVVISELESTQAGQQAQQQALLQAQNEIESAITSLAGQLNAEIARLEEEERRLQREAAQAFLAERERQSLLQQAEETRERITTLTEPMLPTTSDYGWPLASPTIASRYGEDNNSYLALRAPTANAAVTAIEGGRVQAVVLVSANDGFLVSIQHAPDMVVSYTNLQPPIVKPGDVVSKGQLLGYLGGGTLVSPDILKLWVTVGNAFVDPQRQLGF